MNKITKLFVITAGIASISFAGNVVASNQFLPTETVTTNNIDTPQHNLIAQRDDEDDFDRKNIFEELNLSKSQQEQMKSIRDKYQPQIQNLRQEMRAEKEKLGKMMQADTSDARLKTQHQKVLQLGQRIRNKHFDAMLEMRKVLTTKQRRQLSGYTDNNRRSANK